MTVVNHYAPPFAGCNLPHFCLVPPLGVTPSEFRPGLWHHKTKNPWAIIQRFLCDLKFSHFGTLPARDRGRDGRTDTQQQHIEVELESTLVWPIKRKENRL